MESIDQDRVGQVGRCRAEVRRLQRRLGPHRDEPEDHERREDARKAGLARLTKTEKGRRFGGVVAQ